MSDELKKKILIGGVILLVALLLMRYLANKNAGANPGTAATDTTGNATNGDGGPEGGSPSLNATLTEVFYNYQGGPEGSPGVYATPPIGTPGAMPAQPIPGGPVTLPAGAQHPTIPHGPSGPAQPIPPTPVRGAGRLLPPLNRRRMPAQPVGPRNPPGPGRMPPSPVRPGGRMPPHPVPPRPRPAPGRMPPSPDPGGRPVPGRMPPSPVPPSPRPAPGRMPPSPYPGSFPIVTAGGSGPDGMGPAVAGVAAETGPGGSGGPLAYPILDHRAYDAAGIYYVPRIGVWGA